MYGEIPVSTEILLSFVGYNYVGISVLGGMLCVNSEDPAIHRLLPKYRFADGEVLIYFAYIPSGGVRLTLLRKKIPSGGAVFRTASGPFVSWLQAGLLNGENFTESLISPKSLTEMVREDKLSSSTR
ncbi:hypothetical protein P3S68_033488 [Capsicum galapagoense]